jgi:hypothetical protein
MIVPCHLDRVLFPLFVLQVRRGLY